MSFFRPESPPPRQPSPALSPAPLPHPRRQPSQPRVRVHPPLSHGHTLLAMRSMDLTSERIRMGRTFGDTSDSAPQTRQRTRSTHTPTGSPTETHSSTGLSPCHSPRPRVPTPKRTLSASFPSPSPSPTPTMVSPFSPSLKSVVACASDGIACPRPLKPFMFEHTEGPGLPDQQPTKHLRLKPSLRSLPPLEKPKHVGIACLRFFGIKTHPKKISGDVTGL